MSTPSPATFHIHTQHGALDKIGHGHHFNGNADFIQLPGNWGNWHALTIEAWVKTEGPTGDFQAIVSPSDQSFVHFQLFSAGNITVYTDTGPVILPIIPDTPANIWRHVVVIAKSGDSKVLVDGQQVGATNHQRFNHITSTDQLMIGRGHQNGRHFKGDIAGVKIWQDPKGHEGIHDEQFNYLTDKPDLTVIPEHTLFGLKSFHGKYSSAQPDGTIVSDRDWLRGWEKFTIEDAGNGKIGLKSFHGQYLSAQPDGTLQCNRNWLRGWEMFHPVIVGPHQIGLESHFRKYISAQPDGTLTCDREWLRGWEVIQLDKG